MGESAERHAGTVQRSGAARYTRDYYGILAAAVMGRLFERGREVSLFYSHSPGDAKFRQDLMKSVIGDWDVEIGKKQSHFVYFSSRPSFSSILRCSHNYFIISPRRKRLSSKIRFNPCSSAILIHLFP